MTRIALLTNHPKEFAELADHLSKTDESRIEWFGSRKDFLDSISGSAPDLVIIDEVVDGISALKLARKVVMANAMIYIAVVNRLSPEDFHEASEGLGLLAQLPPAPGSREAQSLMTSLKGMQM